MPNLNLIKKTFLALVLVSVMALAIGGKAIAADQICKDADGKAAVCCPVTLPNEEPQYGPAGCVCPVSVSDPDINNQVAPTCLGAQPPADNPACTTAGEAGVHNCLITNPFLVNDVQPVVDFLTALVSVVIIGSIVFAGLQYASASNNAQQLVAARNRIIKSIVALAIFFLLGAIIEFLIPGGIIN